MAESIEERISGIIRLSKQHATSGKIPEASRASYSYGPASFNRPYVSDKGYYSHWPDTLTAIILWAAIGIAGIAGVKYGVVDPLRKWWSGDKAETAQTVEAEKHPPPEGAAKKAIGASPQNGKQHYKALEKSADKAKAAPAYAHEAGKAGEGAVAENAKEDIRKQLEALIALKQREALQYKSAEQTEAAQARQKEKQGEQHAKAAETPMKAAASGNAQTEEKPASEKEKVPTKMPSEVDKKAPTLGEMVAGAGKNTGNASKNRVAAKEKNELAYLDSLRLKEIPEIRKALSNRGVDSEAEYKLLREGKPLLELLIERFPKYGRGVSGFEALLARLEANMKAYETAKEMERRINAEKNAEKEKEKKEKKRIRGEIKDEIRRYEKEFRGFMDDKAINSAESLIAKNFKKEVLPGLEEKVATYGSKEELRVLKEVLEEVFNLKNEPQKSNLESDPLFISYRNLEAEVNAFLKNIDTSPYAYDKFGNWRHEANKLARRLNDKGSDVKSDGLIKLINLAEDAYFHKVSEKLDGNTYKLGTEYYNYYKKKEAGLRLIEMSLNSSYNKDVAYYNYRNASRFYEIIGKIDQAINKMEIAVKLLKKKRGTGFFNTTRWDQQLSIYENRLYQLKDKRKRSNESSQPSRAFLIRKENPFNFRY